ncbi:villin/Gelsolin [Artemisia annua]|uniref:Villin/Gelsolin n=1 Tax=Artemisia annua TaxID=35608 RepID=A0A2U1M8P1_ARTAN|nr:villin/Gelsolin [Artemisia annua]
MTPSSSSSDGIWLCRFRGFHCCPDGEVGNKGIARLTFHLKRQHLSTDELVVWEVYDFTCCESCLSSPEWSNDMSGYIVGISKPSNKEFEPKETDGLVLDAKLLDPVFKVPITAIKYIPHGCRLAFSHALEIVLYKVVAQPSSVDAWVKLIFSFCTLQVYIPKE